MIMIKMAFISNIYTVLGEFMCVCGIFSCSTVLILLTVMPHSHTQEIYLTRSTCLISSRTAIEMVWDNDKVNVKSTFPVPFPTSSESHTIDVGGGANCLISCTYRARGLAFSKRCFPERATSIYCIVIMSCPEPRGRGGYFDLQVHEEVISGHGGSEIAVTQTDMIGGHNGGSSVTTQ